MHVVLFARLHHTSGYILVLITSRELAGIDLDVAHRLRCLAIGLDQTESAFPIRWKLSEDISIEIPFSRALTSFYRNFGKAIWTNNSPVAAALNESGS